MIINTQITQNFVRAFYPYEGYRSVTPLDAARVNRTIFHNHSVHWYYITLIKGCVRLWSPIFLDYLLSVVTLSRDKKSLPKGMRGSCLAHTLSSPSSLMAVLVGSSVPILYQNPACPPRYPLRKGKCCRCRVEPGALPTLNYFIKSWKTSAVSTAVWMVETQLCKLRGTSDTFVYLVPGMFFVN